MNNENLPEDERPAENLKQENEILKLQLLAETGAKVESFQNIPEDIENMFLNQVLQFERSFDKMETQTVYQKIKKPPFKLEQELDDKLITAAYNQLEKILFEHQIVVDYCTEYPVRQKYKFLTEELFNTDVNVSPIPEMISHFIYEEFHPNHEYDIKNRTKEFIEGWFEMNISDNDWYLTEQLVAENGQVYERSDVIKSLNKIFESFTAIENTTYNIDDVSFQFSDDALGLGFAEGSVAYTCVLESGEKTRLEGPFKFYLQCEHDWWQIFFFYFPGFNWSKI